MAGPDISPVLRPDGTRDFYQEGRNFWPWWGTGWPGDEPPHIEKLGAEALSEWHRGYRDIFQEKLEEGMERIYADELRKIPVTYKEWLRSQGDAHGR